MTTAAPTTPAPTTLAPTTAAPTTLAPTTFLTSLAPTTTLTTAAPTTAVPDTNLVADPIIITLYQKGILSWSPARGIDPDLDQSFEVGPIEITLTQEGSMFTVSIDNSVITITLSQQGEYIEGTLITADPIELTVVPNFAYYVIGKVICNWVSWSKVGRPDFTLDESNVAGKMPMRWTGCVYKIIRLNDSVVVYGSGGISIMIRKENVWGMETIRDIGIVSKDAAIGNKSEHYFVDSSNKLFKLNNEGLTLLDYSEYLEDLTDLVLSLDEDTGLLYLCDGTYGFVYDTKNNSFGQGPPQVTGIGNKSGTKYSIGPEDIEVPKLNIKTDIYDLGSRNNKTIKELQIGTDLGNKLEAMVEYRLRNDEEFRTTPWVKVSPNGMAHVPCFGLEFRFNLRAKIYEDIAIDYIKVMGTIHNYDYFNGIE